MYSSSTISNFILSNARNPVSQLKLHKMLYFLQGNAFRMLNISLITEDFEAWTYGPVEPILYNRIGKRGAMSLNGLELHATGTEINQEHQAWLARMVESLDEYSASELVDFSHESNTPWSAVWQNGAGRFNTIPKSLIQHYFVNKA